MDSIYSPSWDDAPYWAEYLACDDYGDWYWYEYEPNYRFGVWWVSRAGRYEVARTNPIEPKNSLQKRKDHNG